VSAEEYTLIPGQDARRARMREVTEFLNLPFPVYAKKYLKIRTKQDGIQPFELNAGQMKLLEHTEAQMQLRGYVRTVLLKARQWGGSTLIQAMAYRDMTCGPRGSKAFIMSHLQSTTSALFAMTKRFNDLMDPRFRPYSTGGSATSLKFDKRDSMYSVGTAGSKNVGHGETTQFLHASEFALWDNANDHLNGIFQTVPTGGKGTKVFVESTAVGMGNEFHRMSMDARKCNSDYWFLFVPWFWFPEYQARVPDSMILTPDEELMQEVMGLSDEQMAFRALKINEMGGGERGEVKFCSQYPTIPEDAFRTATAGSYFSAMYVVRARKSRVEVPYGAKIMGIDPSHIGGDRFSVCVRQGRRARHVGEWRGERTNVSLGRVIMLIKQERPEYVFVDQGGPGAGIVDPLMENQHELGCQVIPVDFGGSPDDDDRYTNKREEMYGRAKEWLEQDLPVQIDDRDDLQTDLTNPQFRYDNAGRVQPESKQTMCKPPRSLPSPDLLESLVLTFAYFVKSKDPERQIVGSVPDPRRPINWRAM
jgi:hypothetical protein